MRESIKGFVKIIADTLPIVEPIYEFGSLQVPKDYLDDFRTKFERWKDYWHGPAGKPLEAFVKSVVPPIVLNLYSRIRYGRIRRS